MKEFILEKQVKMTDNSEVDEQTTVLKFDHQSLRDVLAAIHLINVAPTKENPFPEEWNKQSFTANHYMLTHLSRLIVALGEESILDEAIDTLRNDDNINDCEHILNNLLLVFKQKALNNGDVSDFDFSGLNLINTDLSEWELSPNADFTDAVIGKNTFRKTAHTKEVTCIAVSPDGSRVLTVGRDKVLLWDFGKRSVDSILYTYKVILGAYKCK